MSGDNTTLNAGSGGDTVRDINRSGVKTQVVQLDMGGESAEQLVTYSSPLPATPVSVIGVYQEGVIAGAGNPQWVLSGVVPTNGFELTNNDTAQNLHFRENAPASVAFGPSTVIPPLGRYVSPPGYKPTGPVSVTGDATGQSFIARVF
jgi:hypothetical protein